VTRLIDSFLGGVVIAFCIVTASFLAGFSLFAIKAMLGTWAAVALLAFLVTGGFVKVLIDKRDQSNDQHPH